MKFRFWTIPAMMPDEAQEAVNRFCGTHRVISVEKQFVYDGERSYWALCVCYLESSRNNGEESVSPSRKGKIAYRVVLNEQDFALYVRLRNLCKTLSDQEGIPAYALFTNEQLAAMIQRCVRIPCQPIAAAGVSTTCNAIPPWIFNWRFEYTGCG
jgi:hypothetical protein